jgi:hypothetical protein
MQRREFITFLGGAAAAWPVAARAQQGGRMRRIGVLKSFPSLTKLRTRRSRMGKFVPYRYRAGEDCAPFTHTRTSSIMV